jgi:uncharacterized SAM-binding protein YcdF (DUF218 family)
VSGRLVAVLGYSNGRHDGLHPVCAARLARAESLVEPGDVVLLSGWSRRAGSDSEAELMANAWRGRSRRVVVDPGPRSTFGNVTGAAAVAREVGATDVVLVTSGWHVRRASTLLRAALRGSGAHVRAAPTAERGTPGARFREIACWALVPVQAALASRQRSM